MMDAVEVTSKLLEDVRVLGKRLRRVKDEVDSALRVKRVKGDVYERAAALEIQRVFRGWSLPRTSSNHSLTSGKHTTLVHTFAN